MRNQWRLRGCGCLALSLSLVGCAESVPQRNGGDPPVQTAPAAAKPATTKGEYVRPEMPSSAGLVSPDAPEEFTATDSGLKYRILRHGTDRKPKASNSVEVNYHGWLDDGNVFDSSYDRGESISFPLGGVIPGWTEGLQLIGEGGMIELEIPSDLGYGDGGRPPTIPGGATLHFLVELIEIK
ncbi:MAG: FKBP-type peptidyl-prolyl cis-trans isomerase [Planctomycetaceae bacterium]